MGRELLQYKQFSDVLDEAEEVLKDFGCVWSVRQEFSNSEAESRINEPEFAQPLCAILQIALVDLLQAAGVVPRAVVGHSMGEMAAAYCIGAISRRCAFKLAYYRGVFFTQIPKRSLICCGMLAVGLSAVSIQPYFERVRALTANFNLSLACINSPQNVTVSGEDVQLKLLQDELQASSIFFRKLRVNAGYHSQQLNCIAQDCLQHFESLESGSWIHRIPMISTVSASAVSPKELRNPRYWIENMLSPVEFSSAIERLCTLDESSAEGSPVDLLIEIGPHATLRLPISEIFEHLPSSKPLSYDSVLYHGKPASDSLLKMLGNLFCLGYPVHVRSVNDPAKTQSHELKALVDGPEYPFCHAKDYWYESQLTHNQRFRKHKHISLLGSSVPNWNPLRPQWRYCIRPTELPWLRDHRLGERIVYPASALISMALTTASQLSDPARHIRAFVVRQVCFRSPVAPPFGSDDMETRLSMTPIDTVPDSSKWIWQFEIFVSHASEWSEVCTGIVGSVYNQDLDAQSAIRRKYQDRLTDTRRQCSEEISGLRVYEVLERSGYQYGPTFRGMHTIWNNRKDLANASIDLGLAIAVDQDSQDYVMHPASLDAFIHLSLVPLTFSAEKHGLLHIPTSIEKLWISAVGVKADHKCLQASVKLEQKHNRAALCSLFALDEQESSMRLILDGLELSAIDMPRSKEHQQLPALEHAFSIHTVMDVEMLTPSEIYAWLDQECGTDVSGPTQFWKDVRIYVGQLLLELQAQYRVASGLPEDRVYLSHYLNWIKWQITRNTFSGSLPTTHSPIESRIGTQGGVGRFMVEVANNVRNVLDGRIDVLQLLFENDLVKDFYQDQTFGSLYQSKFETYIRQLALKRPCMDILEIGGGTGSFTRHMLRALEPHDNQQHLYNEYTFTDISPMFFEKAKEEFAAHRHHMNFRKLDISIDLQEQDYAEAQYDLIVASNVLHVTSNLPNTVNAVRKLLKPGGKLLLHETVVPDNLEIGFAFGLIQGWWCGAEAHRSMSPLVTEDAWVSLLSENGFATPDIILRDFTDDDSHHMSIICASVAQELDPSYLSTQVTIVINTGSPSEAALASTLQDMLMSNGKASRTMTLIDASRQEIPFEHVVFLVDMIDPFFPRLNKDTFEALKTVLVSTKQALWVTGGSSKADPAFGMINGFIQVIRIEFPNLEMSILALGEDAGDANASNQESQRIVKVLRRLQLRRDRFDREDCFLHENKFTVRRTGSDNQILQGAKDILEHKATAIETIESARPFALEIDISSEQSGFEIIAEPKNEHSLLGTEVEIEVYAVGLDQADLYIHRGITPSRTLGAQGAGTIKAIGDSLSLQPGDRVCFWHRGALRSTVSVSIDMVARLPEQVPFSEAAVLPNSHLYASYLLAARLRLSCNNSILILARNNSLGQATIRQALKITSLVFAAVFTEEDKRAFESLYQGRISVYAIADGLEGLQCHRMYFDTLLDLSSKPIQSDLFACVSKHGQILRVEEPTRNVDLSSWIPRVPTDVSFSTTTVESFLNDHSEHTGLSLEQAVRSSFSLKSNFPSTNRMFDVSEVSKALDHLRTSPDGHAVIKYTQSQEITVVNKLRPNYRFDPNATYVIAGGFGDLGRSLAKWMVSRGVEYLILFSRSGPHTPAARRMVRDLEEHGVMLRTFECDISDRDCLQSNLETCMQTMPTVKGCIQASGILKVRSIRSSIGYETDSKL